MELRDAARVPATVHVEVGHAYEQRGVAMAPIGVPTRRQGRAEAVATVRVRQREPLHGAGAAAVPHLHDPGVVHVAGVAVRDAGGDVGLAAAPRAAAGSSSPHSFSRSRPFT